MARTTIYVPDDLRERMDDAKEEVNWSQVACRAFEIKLGEIATNKEAKQMQDIIQRLRASKILAEQAEDDLYQEGARVGYSWASNIASWGELQRVPDPDDVSDFSLILEGNTPPGYDEGATPLEVLTSIILGEDPPRKANGVRKTPPDLWWGEILGQDRLRMNLQPVGSADERLVEPNFLRGFVAGACRLRDEVKEQLQA